ncbi:hypothetical protein [Francisella sp. LA112445]|nr:hypothetical protein [Francisella sp. LA112445]
MIEVKTIEKVPHDVLTNRYGVVDKHLNSMPLQRVRIICNQTTL